MRVARLIQYICGLKEVKEQSEKLKDAQKAPHSLAAVVF